MYSEISSNKRATVLLISLYAAILIALGWVAGEYFGDPSTGIVIATVVSTMMTLVGYFAGDRISLASAGAKEVTKREAQELVMIVENLAITAGLPTPRVFVIDDPSPNAFATGRDPAHASVAVTTGLLRRLDRAELEGVLAHELSHIGNYDIRVMTLVVVLVGVVMLLSDMLTRALFHGRDRDAPAALALVGLALAILSPLFAELIKLAVSRKREYLADASGAMLTRHPDGLARALEKIAADDLPLQRANHATAHLFLANPFDPHVTKKFERWFSTHPPIEERIKRLRTMGN
ncbi:zinc metalloprotease HtpX [Patescibacteria group bacterium]|nr:MAG: zinc metalloprotease HtpX [Patescibacteria group bacterium]